MVVQHNITAMNSNRMLGVTTGQQAKSSEKLSSGYRINRAADDAAGLTISEKMRKQIKGLDQASTNAEDGVSAVQTAEGALTEVHSMLQRMNELAVQASNGTNSQADREAIQAEIDQLGTEIDRVAETTKFNEIYLLKGDKETKSVQLEAHDAGLKTTAKGGITVDGSTATMTIAALTADSTINVGGKEITIGKTKKPGSADAYGVDDVKDLVAQAVAQANSIGADSAMAKSDVTVEEATGKISFTVKSVTAQAELDFNLHVGADADMNNKIGVKIDTMNTTFLGIKGLDVVGKDANNVNTNDGGIAATYAIDAIADAVAKVSAQRSALGAIQNRLEHTIANLDNVVENTTAAESRIRDTDMAEEMVSFSKNNILAQAGQSMLAQANQSNQGVLSLLQ